MAKNEQKPQPQLPKPKPPPINHVRDNGTKVKK
jgi:hypothetical protein